MFVHKIGNLDRNRFGINFKAEDIKCELDKKEKNILKKDIINRNNLEE